jgi:hypothetical protein
MYSKINRLYYDFCIGVKEAVTREGQHFPYPYPLQTSGNINTLLDNTLYTAMEGYYLMYKLNPKIDAKTNRGFGRGLFNGDDSLMLFHESALGELEKAFKWLGFTVKEIKTKPYGVFEDIEFKGFSMTKYFNEVQNRFEYFHNPCYLDKWLASTCMEDRDDQSLKESIIEHLALLTQGQGENIVKHYNFYNELFHLLFPNEELPTMTKLKHLIGLDSPLQYSVDTEMYEHLQRDLVLNFFNSSIIM